MENAYIITGSSSGLGASLTKLLRGKGNSVITIDWKGDPDITADLSDEIEQAQAIDAAFKICPSPLGVVSNAGLSPIHPNPFQIVEVNWFAATHILNRFLDQPAKTPQGSAVAISSIGAAIGGDSEFETILHSGNRKEAMAYIEEMYTHDSLEAGILAYSTCKAALARFVRRKAKVWGESGVRLNAVSPGRMETAMLEDLLAHEDVAEGITALPTGIKERGSAANVASVVEFLLDKRSAFIHGQVIYVDGGSEAILRPDLI